MKNKLLIGLALLLLTLPAMGQTKIVQGPPAACGGVYGYNILLLDSPENISYTCGGIGTIPVPNDVWVSTQTSNTAQATANNTSDQNLLSSTIGMPTAMWAMNVPGRTMTLLGAGTYSLGAASTITIKVKLCTVAGCGSGTVTTLLSWTTASQSTTATTLAFNVDAYCATVSGGATGSLECHGTLNFDSGSTLAAAISTFNDSNTAAIGSLPLNGQWFLQTTLAYGTANASNTALIRSQTVDIYGPGVVN